MRPYALPFTTGGAPLGPELPVTCVRQQVTSRAGQRV